MAYMRSIRPKYIIEREMPRVGQLSEAEFQGASQKSYDLLLEMVLTD